MPPAMSGGCLHFRAAVPGTGQLEEGDVAADTQRVSPRALAVERQRVLAAQAYRAGLVAEPAQAAPHYQAGKRQRVGGDPAHRVGSASEVGLAEPQCVEAVAAVAALPSAAATAAAADDHPVASPVAEKDGGGVSSESDSDGECGIGRPAAFGLPLGSVPSGRRWAPWLSVSAAKHVHRMLCQLQPHLERGVE